MNALSFLSMEHALASVLFLLVFTVAVLVEYVRTEGRCGLPFNKANPYRVLHAAAFLVCLVLPWFAVIGIMAIVLYLVLGWFHRKHFPHYYIDHD